MTRQQAPRISRPTTLKSKPRPLPVDKLVPADKARGYKMIMLSIPFVILSSWVLYKRLYQGEEKRVQIGEQTEEGIKWYTPEEIKKKDEEKIATKVFGNEDWLKNSKTNN
ncbi:hypothetical protein CJU89_1498 [Yarrowia sp. B02]|nr:hypothetical protein CJU89_1498 [Yarrowia sp. B02]